LSSPAVIAPNDGHGFGPRHLDFHPNQPWVYVSLEIQSLLHVYRWSGNGLEPAPAYVHDMLADRANVKPRQLGGTVHVHPNGRFVYLINRADWTIDYRGQKVFGGGENSIAVFSIDPRTGERHSSSTPIRTRFVRTFAIDQWTYPGGGEYSAAPSARGQNVVTVPATLSVFRVGDDGSSTSCASMM
jgi:6-phosphogluconolactonase (cycloisomerase 2 family)